MSNQWGRNNQPGNGGSSGFLLPAVLCLVIVAGGGYLWYARQGMQAEIAALAQEKTALNIEIVTLTTDMGKLQAEKDKLAADMKVFRERSGDWAGELEKEFADLKLNEVPKLNRLLDKRDADISALEKEVVALRSDAARAAEDYAGTISKITGELDASSQQVQALEKQMRALDIKRGELDVLLAAANDETAQLKDERDRLRTSLAEQKKQMDARISDLTAAARESRDETVSALQAALASERSKVAALEAQIISAGAAVSSESLAEPDTGTSDEQDTPVRGTQTPDIANEPAKTPRSEASVESALRLTTGLGGLDDGKSDALKEKLVAGSCVTEALESVFDRVPVIVMRNLMRDLKSDC